MWNSLETRLLNSLPRIADRNGKNSIVPSVRKLSDEWVERIAEMHDYAAYEDDWDGQGAAALPNDLSSNAFDLASALRANGVAAPSCVVPGVNGSMSLEWLLGEEKSIEIEVTGADSAEVFIYAPQKPVTYWEMRVK